MISFQNAANRQHFTQLVAHLSKYDELGGDKITKSKVIELLTTET